MTPRRDPEALLAHAGWMRALARGLVGDPDDADDVVQDAQLAALLRPPPAEASARAWLGAVVRNLSVRKRRARLHRTDREARAARPEGEPSHADTLERLDLQRVLLEAVRALDEPFRTTIVARYFEGRTSAEIARGAGVAPGTVRWRLKRGLELLREKLDHEHPRESWMLLLAPLCRLEPAAAAAPVALATSTTLLQGALTVSLLKLGIPLALVSIVGIAWWQLEHAPGNAPLPARSDAAPSTASEPRMEQRTVAAADTRVVPEARPEAATVAPQAAVVAGAPAQPAQGAGQMAVRFVDAQGAPWADVRLQLLDFRSETEPRLTGPEAVSGADGRAELEVAFPGWADDEWRFEFLARRETLAQKKITAVLRVGTLVQLGDVVLGPAARVSGRAVDTSGLAVPGARVGAAPAESIDASNAERVMRVGCEAFDPYLTVASATDGSFVLDAAEPGAMRIWAHTDGMRYGWTEPLELQAGQERTDVVVVLAPLARTDRIVGRVFDPSGEPCPAGLMSLASGRGTTFNTDALGRFEILVSDTSAVYELTATARDFTPVTLRDVRPGDEVELRFAAGRTMLLHVHDEQGQPLAGVEAHVTVSGMGQQAPLETISAGDYRVTCPADEFRLEVRAAGHRPSDEGKFTGAALPPSLDVVLARTPRVHGRVIAGGKPLAGAEVELRYYDASGDMTVNGLRVVSSPFVDSSVTSDTEGRFELELVDDRPFLVRAKHPAWALGESGPFPAADAEKTAVVIELTAGGTIEGVLRSASGARLESRFVLAHHGDGDARCTRTDSEGRYRFEKLAPGPWLVLVREEELDPGTTSYSSYRGDDPVEWSCTVAAGHTTRFDLDVP